MSKAIYIFQAIACAAVTLFAAAYALRSLIGGQAFCAALFGAMALASFRLLAPRRHGGSEEAKI